MKQSCLKNSTKFHCVKSVRIRSFFGPNAGKYGSKKLQIRTLLRQCLEPITHGAHKCKFENANVNTFHKT